jgi:DNA-binding CsgD family transcriptional regulator
MSVSSLRAVRPSAGAIFRGVAIVGIAAMIVGGTAAELAGASGYLPFGAHAVAYILGLIAVGVLVGMRRAPLTAAGVSLVAAVGGHFLGIPGGAAGMALFYATFELARIGRRTTTWAAFVLPFLWFGALLLPPQGVVIDSPALLGPVAGMLWMAGTGVAVRRTRPASPSEKTNLGHVPGVGIQTIVGPGGGELSVLTPREREIVALVGTGLDNTAIAGILFVSPVTVKSHVNHAMGKLGTTTRAQLVARAHREGLVTH